MNLAGSKRGFPRYKHVYPRAYTVEYTYPRDAECNGALIKSLIANEREIEKERERDIVRAYAGILSKCVPFLLERV